MKAGIVVEPGKPPIYGDFREPEPTVDEVRITVSASAISPVAKSRASGTHYSSSGGVPFVVGIDGVGRLDDGRHVYFLLPDAPLGGMSEQTVVPLSRCIALPEELDGVTAAAIANPGMSAWAAFKERAKLAAGETVLVNGATGAAGRLAVQIAKYMGAKKVIAAGRNVEALEETKALGADVTIPLADSGDQFEDALREQFQAGIDVVLDYLWGQSAERMLIAGAKEGKNAVPIRFIQIGSVSAPTISLPSAALRSSAIEMMGSGIGSISLNRLVKSVEELLQATVPGKFQIATKTFPLSDIANAWAIKSNAPRAVMQIG